MRQRFQAGGRGSDGLESAEPAGSRRPWSTMPWTWSGVMVSTVPIFAAAGWPVAGRKVAGLKGLQRRSPEADVCGSVG